MIWHDVWPLAKRTSTQRVAYDHLYNQRWAKNWELRENLPRRLRHGLRRRGGQTHNKGKYLGPFKIKLCSGFQLRRPGSRCFLFCRDQWRRALCQRRCGPFFTKSFILSFYWILGNYFLRRLKNKGIDNAITLQQVLLWAPQRCCPTQASLTKTLLCGTWASPDFQGKATFNLSHL